MDEMYHKASPTQRGLLILLLVAGVIINLTVSTQISSLIYITVLAISSAGFAFLYGRRSRWFMTPAGRAQFWSQVSFAVLTAWILGGLWFGQWEWRNEVRDWLFMFFALAGANSFYVLINVQHREIHQPSTVEGETEAK
jgi:hypothetical protein